MAVSSGTEVVEAIHQRPGDAVHVLGNLARCADAMFEWVVVVATRAGVHGGYEHEVAGVGDAILGSGNVDDAILEGLA